MESSVKSKNINPRGIKHKGQNSENKEFRIKVFGSKFYAIHKLLK